MGGCDEDGVKLDSVVNVLKEIGVMRFVASCIRGAATARSGRTVLESIAKADSCYGSEFAVCC